MRALLFILLILPCAARSQTSKFYKEKGILKADANYRINQFSLKRAAAIEQQIIPMISQTIKYPVQARENDLSGNLIVKFFMQNKQVKYDVVKFSNTVFKDGIINFLNIQEKRKLLKIFGSSDKVVFYLPIEFSLFKEDDFTSIREEEKYVDQSNYLVIMGFKSDKRIP